MGAGTEIPTDELESFYSIIPNENEVIAFKERLTDHAIESFETLRSLQPPYCLKKLDGPEKFVIKILQDESVIEKAHIMQTIDKMSNLLGQTVSVIDSWSHLEIFLVKND